MLVFVYFRLQNRQCLMRGKGKLCIKTNVIFRKIALKIFIQKWLWVEVKQQVLQNQMHYTNIRAIKTTWTQSRSFFNIEHILWYL